MLAFEWSRRRIGGESESVETVSIVRSSLKGLVLGKHGLSPLAVFSKCIIYLKTKKSGPLIKAAGFVFFF